jgi:predicted MPP superfamily phosphohydrolase
MKIALTSDLHVFLTSEKSIKIMFATMAGENPDIVVIAGDHSGTHEGHRGTKAVFKMARSALPNTPIVACLGNHDYWIRGNKKKTDLLGVNYHHPSIDQFNENYQKIVSHADKYGIHLLEKRGVFRHTDIWGIVIAGHGLWYKYPPNSNDDRYLPLGIDGDTHRYMYKRTTDALLKQLNQLDDANDGIRVFVSHFPIFNITDHDAVWCGDPFLGQMLHDDYQFTTFLNGHSHGNKNGPIRWECGSDYYNPKYKIVGV